MDLSNCLNISLRFKLLQEQEAIYIGLQDEEERKKVSALLERVKGKRDLVVSIAAVMDPQQGISFCPSYSVDGFYVKLVLDSENSDEYLSCFAPLESFFPLFATALPSALKNGNTFEDNRLKLTVTPFGVFEEEVNKSTVLGSEAVQCC